MVQSINNQDFNQVVLASRVPVLVSFWTPWCGICKIIEPQLGQIEATAASALQIFKVNADENFVLANRYRLTNIPTLLLFSGGKVIYRIDAFHNRDDLNGQLKQMLTQVLPCPFTA